MSATNDKASVPDSSPHAGVEPDVSVCIVNWNTRALIDRCLSSIYQTKQSVVFDVVVVDNGSQDGSQRLISESYPLVRLIQNTDNRGFGSGNNQAICASTGRYCLLLNSDTLIFDGTLDAMVAFMDRHPQAAVVTGKVFRDVGMPDIVISYAPTVPSPWILFFNDLISITGLKKFFPNSRLIKRWTWIGRNPEQEQEVATVTGACMGVRRDAITQVGLFDEAFFMYLEESDWCYRFLKAGWKLYYTPTVAIVHFCEGSSRLRSDRDQLYYRSLAYYFKKHFGYSGWATYLLQEYLLLRWLRSLHRLLRGAKA